MHFSAQLSCSGLYLLILSHLSHLKFSCGKSTLIKLVVGALRPLKGKGGVDARAKIEYLAQHQLEQLDPDGTPMSTMLDRYPGDRGNQHCQELRNYLANFGLGGRSVAEAANQHHVRRSKMSSVPRLRHVQEAPLAYS